MTDEPTPTEPTPEPEPEPVAEPTVDPSEPQEVGSLPDWTQKMIKDLRTEAASNRTKASTAEQTRQETMDAIAKALGMKDDDDPAAAAKTAAEERDAARQEAKATKVENAVLRMAGKHGASPESLTDSRSFMQQLESIDPAADDFASQVEATIKTAVEANPALKGATSAPTRSGGPVGGGTPVPGQLSREDIKGMKPEEISKAKEDGQLNQLLGIT